MVDRALVAAILARPGIRLAAMGLSAVVVVAALSNLAISVTFGFNFDELPEGYGGEGGLPEGFVPPPGDYSELIKQYQGMPPPYMGQPPEGMEGGGSGEGGVPPEGGSGEGQGGQNSGSGEGTGSGSGSGEGTGGSGDGPKFPEKIPDGAGEAIRPGVGENSVGDLSKLPDGGDGFGGGDLFGGMGDFMANPMDPKTFLIVLGVIGGIVGGIVGGRYLLHWLRDRQRPAEAGPAGPAKRLTPRSLPKDARMAVLIAYETFTIHGRRHGLEYQEHETPREFGRRAVAAGLVGSDKALEELTDLYEEARLSTHAIPARHRERAVDCLKRLAAPT